MATSQSGMKKDKWPFMTSQAVPSPLIMKLTAENHAQGFLLDEELMAGVTEHPESGGQFLAYVIRHTTGEYLGYQTHPTLDSALKAIAGVRRDWIFEKASGCGDECGEGLCGKKGTCAKKSVCADAKECPISPSLK
jgi:hypothetical protein